MKKYVRIHLRSIKEPIYLSLEKWENIINDNKTLVAFKLDNEEDWNGRVLNKSDVTFSEFDKAYTEKMNEPNFSFYKNIETNTVVKLLDGQLLDDASKYIKL